MVVSFPDIGSQRGLNLPEHFKHLRTAIEPDEERRAQAVEIAGLVRQYLEDHTTFLTRHPHSRLTGSYARHTTIHGIKDVDFVVFIDPGDGEPNPETVLRDLFTALSGLAAALGDRGKPVRRKQRRSINVYLEEADFSLDIVPVWAPDGTATEAVLRVPDREWVEWVETRPLGYGQALSDLNGDNSGRVVPLIKLLKHWAGVQIKAGKPKGFWLELMVYHALNDGLVTAKGKTDAVLFRDTLEAIRDWFQPSLDAGVVPAISDPMFPNSADHNVGFNWELAHFRRFMSELDESIGWANRALAKSADEVEDAVALWQKVFGEEYFQTDRAWVRDDRAAHIGQMVAAGSAAVGPSGLVSGHERSNQHAIPIRPTRFYGDV